MKCTSNTPTSRELDYERTVRSSVKSAESYRKYIIHENYLEVDGVAYRLGVQKINMVRICLSKATTNLRNKVPIV